MLKSALTIALIAGLIVAGLWLWRTTSQTALVSHERRTAEQTRAALDAVLCDDAPCKVELLDRLEPRAWRMRLLIGYEVMCLRVFIDRVDAQRV